MTAALAARQVAGGTPQTLAASLGGFAGTPRRQDSAQVQEPQPPSGSSGAGSRGRPRYHLSFRGAVGAEWVKLRTVRFTWINTIIQVVVGPGTAALLALVALRAVQDGYAAGPGSYDTWSGAVLANQGPALVGTVTALVLGVLMVTSEYSSGSIKVSLSADPRRGQVFGAKVVGIVGVVAAIGVASVAFSLVVVKLVLGSGLIPAELNAEAIKAMIGVVIYLIAVALIGLGMGFALRSSAGAVTLGLGLFFVLDLALQIGASASRVIEIIQELLPVNAGMLLWGGPSASQGAVITGYGSGLGILAAWVVLALGSGYLVLRSRDA